jgi:integrase
MRTRLSYVKAYKDRHGRMRYYFRRKGQSDIALPGKPNSAEFQLAYHAAMAAVRRDIGARRSPSGSVSAIIAAYYQDHSFLAFAESTRSMRRRILEKFRQAGGNRPLKDLTKGHIVSVFLSQLPPFERNNWLKTLRGLMKFALEASYIDADPTAGVARSTAVAGSIHTWDEVEIAQFEARHAVGSMPRLALTLLLYTAQRRSDVVRMGPRHIRDGVLFVRQKKTKMEKTDRVLRIPVHAELRRIIDATPCGNFTFLVTREGVPFSEKGFGVRFAGWVKQAGLPEGCSAHGLRKAACVRLVEAGCSIPEVQAISGHRNMAQVKPYIEAVNQARLAEVAMRRLQPKSENSGENKVSNRNV